MHYVNKKGISYYLHKLIVTLRGSKREQTIYYFAKKIGRNVWNELPEGFEIVENTKTGMPVLRRIKHV